MEGLKLLWKELEGCGFICICHIYLYFKSRVPTIFNYFFSTVLNGVQHILILICFPGGLQGNGTVTEGEQLPEGSS